MDGFSDRSSILLTSILTVKKALIFGAFFRFKKRERRLRQVYFISGFLSIFGQEMKNISLSCGL